MTVAEAMQVIERAQDDLSVPPAAVSEAVDALVKRTAETYTKESGAYAAARNERPTEWDEVMNRMLLERVRGQIASDALKAGDDGRWRLLDVGAGHGRDLIHFSREPDVVPIALDNSAGFVDLLMKCAEENDLPPSSVVVADMRDLRMFDDSSFQCVRNHATLHHLPVVGDGIGADAAVAETRRVLAPGGVFYVLVKAGLGVQIIDTREGMDGRFFQLFTEDLLMQVLERHDFSVVHLEERLEPRESGNVEWIFCLAVAS